MDDRELLELAAKAAGLNVRWHEESHFGPTMEIMEGEYGGPPWNPLNNYADAFDLLVRLRVSINYSIGRIEASTSGDGEYCESFAMEHLTDKFAENTCRAIVRAAAEIGKAMK